MQTESKMQTAVTCVENWSVRSLGQWIIESKVCLLSMLGRKKKGSRLRLCFWVVDMYFYMYFAGFYLPLNPSATTVYARSTFYPSLRFTFSL